MRRTAAKKKTRSTRRCRASELDCLGEEEEEGTTVLLPRLDLLLVAGNDGGERRRPLSERNHGALGLGFGSGGKREGERSKWSRASFLSSRGGQGGEEEATAAREPRRQAAAVIPLSPQLKKALTVGTHCQGFNLFPFPFYFQ